NHWLLLASIGFYWLLLAYIGLSRFVGLVRRIDPPLGSCCNASTLQNHPHLPRPMRWHHQHFLNIRRPAAARDADIIGQRLPPHHLVREPRIELANVVHQ